MRPLTCERLEARETPAVMYAVGGVVTVPGVGTVRPFEPEAAHLEINLVQDGGLIWVGPGPGGGPRLQSYDARTLTRLTDEMVGPIDSRTGVRVAAYVPYLSPLRAEPHPTRPGDAAPVQRQLDLIPEPVAAHLAATGFRVLVFGAPGGLPTLPEFAELAGRPVGQPGTGGLGWDDVTAATTRDVTYVRADQADRVVREVGIGVYNRLTAAERADWLAAHAAHEWGSDGLRLVPAEGFAEAFGWWVRAGRDVGGFFGRLAAGRGW